MAYPLSSSLVEFTFNAVQADLRNVKTSCLAVQAGTAAGAATPAYNLINMANACRSYRADFALIAGNAPLQAQLIPYVQAQLAGASALAVTTEYTNLNTLCDNVLTALITDYPHDGSGRLLDRTYTKLAGEVWITLTAAQLPNVMPAVAALVAAIV